MNERDDISKGQSLIMRSAIKGGPVCCKSEHRSWFRMGWGGVGWGRVRWGGRPLRGSAG